MMNAALQAAKLNKTFVTGDSRTDAVKDATLSFRQGEIVALTGPSGCGKTTLLNMLGLILQPTSGAIVIGDTDAAALTDKRRAEYRNRVFGYVVQDFALVEEYTALENIEIPLIYARRRLLAAQRRQKILAALRQVGLENKLKARVQNLSGGQRQRVAIARAIVNEPNIIIADEPTGSLDSANSQDVFHLLKTLAQNGKTVIVATHNLQLAQQCDREIRMLDGEIVAQ